GDFASNDFDPDENAGTANSLKTTDNSNDVFIIKYDNNGKFIIAKGMGGTGRESPNGMYVDAAGNIYLTGRTDKNADFDPDGSAMATIGNFNQDIFIAKYFPN